MIALFAMLALLIGGLAIIVGARRVGARFVVGGIFVLIALRLVGRDLAWAASDRSSWATACLIALLVIATAAIIQFIRHRHRARTWTSKSSVFGRPETSTKRRVERD